MYTHVYIIQCIILKLVLKYISCIRLFGYAQIRQLMRCIRVLVAATSRIHPTKLATVTKCVKWKETAATTTATNVHVRSTFTTQ